MTPKRFLNHVVRFWTTKSFGLKNMLEVLNSDLMVNKMQFLVLRFERSESFKCCRTLDTYLKN